MIRHIKFTLVRKLTESTEVAGSRYDFMTKCDTSANVIAQRRAHPGLDALKRKMLVLPISQGTRQLPLRSSETAKIAIILARRAVGGG